MIKSTQSLAEYTDWFEDDQQQDQLSSQRSRRTEVGLMPTRAFLAASRAQRRSRTTKKVISRGRFGGAHRRRKKKLLW